MSGWSIIPAIFNAIGGGIKKNDEDYTKAAREGYAAGRQPRMQYQEAQQPNKDEAMTPSRVVRPVDRLLTGGYNPMEQVFAGALEGEKSLYQPSQGVVAGGFAVQPTHVDSSSSAAPSSKMDNYLNYMKYRRGV